jgi:(E)-4-hydroxy-3-methylbut-2-enyl-diphosphate synthase
MNYCANPFFWQRRPTREVKVGHVGVGGDNPIRVQTMLTSDTMNTEACVREAIPIIEAGCEILRLTAPSINDAKNLKNIIAELRRRGFNTPIIADIHFVPAAAMEAALWCEKVRINPGNYADRKKFAVLEYTDDQYEEELARLEEAFTPLVLRCKELGRAMRIGTNHGSLSDRIMNRYGDTPLGMAESALEFLRICRKHNYHDIILSMKASNPKVMIEAYRLLVARMNEEGPDWNYPLHLGVTEAGEGEDGRIKSAIGIGALLEDGLGDTVRVSLTEDSVHEIPVCQELVRKYNTLWEWQKAGRRVMRASLPITEKRDPFTYARRTTRETVVGHLHIGHENPPRVAVHVPINATIGEIQRITTAEPDSFAEILQFRVGSDADLDKLGSLRLSLRAKKISTPIAVQVPSVAVEEILLSRPKLFEKLNVPFAVGTEVRSLLRAAHEHTVQLEIEADSPEHFVDVCEKLAKTLVKCPDRAAIVAVRRADGLDVIGAYRILAAKLAERNLDTPILLCDRIRGLSGQPATKDPLLAASTNLGALLCDGIGDAVEITGEHDPLKALKLAYNILQATGARSFKTDYVTCPSCGRTLFDLQTVLARIKSRTSHLKGVKIAVMGCIVNGPGEMADADFGYVGTAPGKISLWVGKKQVKQHVHEELAVDELVALIKEHGKWIEPPSEAKK